MKASADEVLMGTPNLKKQKEWLKEFIEFGIRTMWKKVGGLKGNSKTIGAAVAVIVLLKYI